MHRWTLTALLASAAGFAAWLAPTSTRLSPTRPPTPMVGVPTVPAPMAAALAPDVGGGPLDLSVALDATGVVRDTVTERYVVVTVRAPEAATGSRLPVDLALVVDTSGSMSGDGKILEARRAAHALVDQLGPEDRFSLVTFEDRAQRLLALGHHGGPDAHALVESLAPGGGTNLSAGLSEGFATLRGSSAARSRKVLLMTDGRANQGATLPAELTRIAATSGMSVSAIGLGLDYDEGLLAAIADASGGRYHFVDAATDLAPVYTAELESAAHLVASKNRLELDFGAAVTPVEVLNWPGSVTAHGASVVLNDLASGQTRSVVVKVLVDAGVQDSVPVAAATLTGTSVATGDAFLTRRHVHATVVAHPADVDALVDKQAMTQATNAVAGWTAVQANAAYQQGDGERAKGLLKTASQWMRRQNTTYDLAIPEADAQRLEELGYLDDGVAQKATLSAGRSLGGIE